MAADDALIIGGGMLGLLSARALVRRGLRVRILERGPFGREASWAGGGILSPLYPWRYAAAVQDLAAAGAAAWPALAEALLADTGIDIEYWRCGLEMRGLADHGRALAWARRRGVAVERRGAALFFPQVGQLRNPRALRALQADLARRGVELASDHEVVELERRGGRVTAAIDRGGRRWPAGVVVVANGAWSGLLLRRLGVDLPIRPVRGQMILYAPGAVVVPHVVLEGGRYLIPRRDGRLVVGSTVEDTGFDKEATPAARRALRDFAERLVPALRHALVEHHWAGLRPGCGGGLPYIAEHPDIAGLYLNAGHYRNGIVMAPAAAELLAALICRETPLLDPAPYRFDAPRPALAL